MRTDIFGRVKNTKLADNKPLLPLFEAIMNSIHAILYTKIDDGKITIEINRDEDLLDEDGRKFGKITDFIITDNGIGFTKENFDSFTTSDSTYKEKLGGKGVGRFLWLVAFDHVEVESKYRDEETKAHFRKFSFISKGDGIKDHQDELIDDNDIFTKIKLLNFKSKYQQKSPKKTETIAVYIIEHFLEYFRQGNCPKIVLKDISDSEIFDLNEIFEKQMLANSKPDVFEINGNKFYCQHVQLYTTHIKDHLIHYCAHDRIVKSDRSLRIPNLVSPLYNSEHKPFIYACYVESDFLNENVNPSRVDFDIAEDSNGLEIQSTNFEEIRKTVGTKIKEYLEPFTSPIKDKKENRIKDFVNNNAPMYRSIMRHIPKYIDDIDPNIDDDKLDLKLYEAYQSLQIETKKEGQLLLQQDSSYVENFDEYSQKFSDYFEKVKEINMSDLARYVCHRKAVIDFLQKQLEIQDGGKYNRENQIHEIIFPMGKTSDEVPEDYHNLWLIDEKLVYHTFLASDKQLRTQDRLDNNSSKEPDIIIFDKACAFVDEESPFSHVTIVELKRPMRENYTNDDPISQVIGYIRDIKAGKAKNEKGRLVDIKGEIPFYCYILCDLTSKIKDYAIDKDYKEIPGGQGYFGFNTTLNAYIEIISYDKMIGNAKKRNDIFFKKLGIHSSTKQ